MLLLLPLLPALLLLGVGGCTALHPSSSSDPSSASGHGAITREAAAQRSRWIARPLVTLWLSLDSEAESYEGRASLQFRIRARDELKGERFTAPRLDFAGGTVKTLVVNGKAVTGADLSRRTSDGQTIELKAGELELGGLNRIDITYSHPYSQTGHGLTRYKDPLDGETYIYSNLEPHHAREVLPVFDQPDLKAAYELTVEAPEKWTVIANTPESKVGAPRGGRRTWEFPPSPHFSPYVFAVMAGPWAKWSRESSEGIPLRLFARKSLEKEFAPETRAWFDITDAALKFFAERFGHPYPYAKFDQLLVPEFPAGGMENVAAVTYTEGLMLRTKPTRSRQFSRADTIFHEVAHMWFGNLVTPRWWNGLWLNESFATFASHWGLVETGLFPEAWGLFFDRAKSWAYFEDELVTTHPVETSAPDTSFALASFDGITYGKGAAVLKQLAFRIGYDDLSEGLQRYFRKHALRNTTLADFMTVLSETSGENLSVWQRDWLQTTGFNTIQARFTCEEVEGKPLQLSTLEIVQEPISQLRSHQLKVGVFSPARTFRTKRGKAASTSAEVLELPVRITSEVTPVKVPAGTACPTFVMPNLDDESYVAVRFDEESLDTAEKSLSSFEDSLLRRMVWHSLWQMVIHAELSPDRYLALAEKQLPRETDETILTNVLGRLAQTRLGSSSVVRFTSDASRKAVALRAEKLACSLFDAQKPATQVRLALWDSCLSATHSVPGVTRVAAWLSGGKPPAGIPWDYEQRWKMAAVLGRSGSPAAELQIEKLEKEDRSDRGRKRALQIRAQFPDAAMKAALIDALLPAMGGPSPAGTETLSLEARRDQALGLLISGQEELLDGLTDRYFEALPRLVISSEPEHATRMASLLFPAFCRKDIAERARALASAEIDRFPESVLEVLRAQAQLEERCERVRTEAASRSGAPGKLEKK